MLVELVSTDILSKTAVRYSKRYILIKGSIVVVTDYKPSDIKYVRRLRLCNDGRVNMHGLPNKVVVRGQEMGASDVLKALIFSGGELRVIAQLVLIIWLPIRAQKLRILR